MEMEEFVLGFERVTDQKLNLLDKANGQCRNIVVLPSRGLEMYQ